MQLTFVEVGALFALGAIIASFIGLLAARLSTGAPILVGRSKCDACGVSLSPLALVPIFSWIIARGRCLACKARIGASSLVAEASLGLLFVLAYAKLGLSLELLFVLAALALLAGLVLYDLAHAILPPALLAPFVLCALVVAVLSAPHLGAFVVALLTALLLGSCLALVHLASGGRAMGFADAPLAFGLALLAGPLALSGFLYSFWVGGAIGIILLVLRALGTKIKSEVPFAPFLAAGFLLAYFTSWDAFMLIGELMRFVSA